MRFGVIAMDFMVFSSFFRWIWTCALYLNGFNMSWICYGYCLASFFVSSSFALKALDRTTWGESLKWLRNFSAFFILDTFGCLGWIGLSDMFWCRFLKLWNLIEGGKKWHKILQIRSSCLYCYLNHWKIGISGQISHIVTWFTFYLIRI